MDRKQLAELVRDEIRTRGISEREAGRQAGVAHTTISRIMDGKVVSLDTLLKVATWLRVDVNDLMASELETDEGVAAAIASIIRDEPELAEVFRKAAEMVSNGELSPDAVKEILRYIGWRITDDSARRKESE